MPTQIRDAILRLLLSPKTYKWFVLLLFIYFSSSVGIYHLERGTNPQFTSVWDGLLWGLNTLIVFNGSGVTLITPHAKLFSFIVRLVGVGLISLCVGAITGMFLELKKKSEKGLLSVNIKNHFILIGWSYRALSLIKELDLLKREVILIDDQIRHSPLPKKKNFHFIYGSPTKKEVLLRANLGEAKKLIILAIGEDETTADSKNILVALTAKNISPDLFVCVEIINSENRFHLEKIGCESIIEIDSILTKIVGQEIGTPGVSEIFKEINNKFTQTKLLKSKIPRKWHGKTFCEFCVALKTESNTLALGIERQKEKYLNPPGDFILNLGDLYYYIR